jgi:hypothetical protein
MLTLCTFEGKNNFLHNYINATEEGPVQGWNTFTRNGDKSMRHVWLLVGVFAKTFSFKSSQSECIDINSEATLCRHVVIVGICLPMPSFAVERLECNA